MLDWAAWQLQFSPAACGTLRKHVTKHFPQPAAQTVNYVRFALVDVEGTPRNGFGVQTQEIMLATGGDRLRRLT